VIIFNAVKDHLPCLLSEDVRQNASSCMWKHMYLNKCSSGNEFYECIEPTISECKSEVDPALQGAAKKLADFVENCSSADEGETTGITSDTNTLPDLSLEESGRGYKWSEYWCDERRGRCSDVLKKYYRGSSSSWSIRRETPLSKQCSEGLQYKTCLNVVANYPACKDGRDGMLHVAKSIEKLYQFICVTKFDSLKNHLDCWLSDTIANSSYCFNRFMNRNNCSKGADLYKCFEPAIHESPKCTPDLNPLLRNFAKRLASLSPVCFTDEPEEEEVNKVTPGEVPVAGSSWSKEFEKDGIFVQVNVQVSVKGNKTKRLVDFLSL